MKTPIAGAWAAAALFLAACEGGHPAPSVSIGIVSAIPEHAKFTTSAPTTRQSPMPTYTGTRKLTKSDSGATVQLSIGEPVRVSLPAEYDPPAATGNALARSAISGGYPTRRPVDATFTAVRGGRADITTGTDYPCLHATPSCEIAQSGWVVHVIVIGHLSQRGFVRTFTWVSSAASTGCARPARRTWPPVVRRNPDAGRATRHRTGQRIPGNLTAAIRCRDLARTPRRPAAPLAARARRHHHAAGPVTRRELPG